MSRVESLANPASTLIEFDSIGTVDSQSANNSALRLLGLISSLIRILKRSLGYSGSCDVEVADDTSSLLNGLVKLGVGSGLAEDELSPTARLRYEAWDPPRPGSIDPGFDTEGGNSVGNFGGFAEMVMLLGKR